MANITAFTPGDLVISVYGNGDGSGNYTDNQASPITLEELTTSGTVVGQLVLPQTATLTNGVTENAISGEYGSSSEGTLELSADGQSLTIAGYGINAATYNNAEAGVTGSKAAGGAYGNNALAQTYSVPNGGTNGAPAGVTPVARVIADVRANGTVDTSTALFNVDNENNPRSVVTTDGTSFYIAGQGVKGDTTQGLFYAKDGASSSTAINTTTDQRTAQIYNGNLYVSTDSTQGTGGNKSTDNISVYNGEPTGAATPTILPGISQTITLTAAQENGTNNARVGSTVYLSPENYFFANATTLYVADGGQPKGGNAGAAGLGDGGLQKWTLSNGTWTLNYTVPVPGQVANTASSGTTGLIGLTGQVVGNTVSLYATNSTIGDLDQTYLYGINDPLNATTAANTSVTQLAAAAPDTNIRGVAFAPAAAVCYCSGTLIRTARGDVAVEHLRVGDLAVTSSGAHRPIRWLGHQTIRPAGTMQPRSLWPVRVAAGAFGDNKPSTDLFLSPGHSVCVGVIDEVLVPIQELVNGSTIAYVDVDEVTYWHVELDSHDILIANNMPAESFLEMGANRAVFAEGRGLGDPSAEVVGRTHADFCRRFVDGGPLLAATRDELRRRAERLGWTESRAVTIAVLVDGRSLVPIRRHGEALVALPPLAGDIRVASSMTVPAMLGGADPRRLGLAVYALELVDADGATRRLDLDAPELASCFHTGERDEGLHYRYTAGDLVLPPAATAGLAAPLILRLAYEPSTPRGWSAPEPLRGRPQLRMVA